MFVLTFLLNGGLNHIIFLFLLLVFDDGVSSQFSSAEYCKVVLNYYDVVRSGRKARIS